MGRIPPSRSMQAGSIYGLTHSAYGYLERCLVGLIQFIPVDAAASCFATTVCLDQQLSHLKRRLVLVTCVDVAIRFWPGLVFRQLLLDGKAQRPFVPLTVFEQQRYAGGMVGGAIPEYRLPGWVYREEIERIPGRYRVRRERGTAQLAPELRLNSK